MGSPFTQSGRKTSSVSPESAMVTVGCDGSSETPFDVVACCESVVLLCWSVPEVIDVVPAIPWASPTREPACCEMYEGCISLPDEFEGCPAPFPLVASPALDCPFWRDGSIAPTSGNTYASGCASICSISLMAWLNSALQNRDMGEKSLATCSFRRVHERKNGFVCACFSRLA